MKKQYIITFAIICNFQFVVSTLQAQSVEYSYDAAGNRIQRKEIILCPGCSNERLAQQQELSENLTPNLKLTVFPNPVKELLNLKVEGEFQSYQVSLTDITGKVFFTKTINESNSQLNFSDYPKGIYMLKTGLNHQFKEWKIVKQ